jgi:hypothetical protein
MLAQGARVPRFIKQMADNALAPPATAELARALDTQNVDGRAMLDLKLQGTALFVDAARLYALAHGLNHCWARARAWRRLAPLMHVAPQEGEAWVTAFEFLQMLRLQVQMGRSTAGSQAPVGNANLVDTATLNDIDQRMLKETCASPGGCSSAWNWTISAEPLQTAMLTSLKRWWRPPPTLDATRWVVLDVESTGLDVRRDRLLAIAAVAVQVTDGRARIDVGDSFEVVLGRAAEPALSAPRQGQHLLHGIGVGDEARAHACRTRR